MKFDDKEYSIYRGEKLEVEIFGASHSEEIGVIVKGFNGENIDVDKVQEFVDRRKPKNQIRNPSGFYVKV